MSTVDDLDSPNSTKVTNSLALLHTGTGTLTETGRPLILSSCLVVFVDRYYSDTI